MVKPVIVTPLFEDSLLLENIKEYSSIEQTEIKFMDRYRTEEIIPMTFIEERKEEYIEDNGYNFDTSYSIFTFIPKFEKCSGMIAIRDSRKRTSKKMLHERDTITNVNKYHSLTNFGATSMFNNAIIGLTSCERFIKEMKYLLDVYKDNEEIITFNCLLNVLNGINDEKLELSQNPIFKRWNNFSDQNIPDCYEILENMLNDIYQKLKEQSMHNEDSIHELPLELLFETKTKFRNEIIRDIKIHSDFAIHLSIPKIIDKLTLEDLLNIYFDDVPCKTKSCTNDDKIRLISKKYLLNPLPETVCIRIIRSFNNGINIEKINTFVQFDTKLTLKSTNKPNIYEINDYEQEKQINQTQVNVYRLKSVVAESNNIRTEDYICYKKSKDIWLLNEDYLIYEVNEDIVLRSIACLLFYEKIEQT